jgi:hypothetical protein
MKDIVRVHGTPLHRARGQKLSGLRRNPMTSRRVAVLTAILIGSFAITPAAHAATRTWNPSTNLMFGDFRFSNTQRWFPNGTLLPADDLQFTTGMNGSTSGVVNVAANQSLLVTNDISVIVAMESTHQYQLMSSLTVGAGGSGDESRLTLQGGRRRRRLSRQTSTSEDRRQRRV